MEIAENILNLIGRTPLVKINKLNEDGFATVAAKLESFNPGVNKRSPRIEHD